MRAGARWQQGLPPDEKIKRRLIRAAYAGDEASVETLLAAHPHVQSDHFECLADALCEPWNQGGTGTSRISESVNVETPPPIIAALIAKRSGCVRLLLEYGAAAYRPPPPTGSAARPPPSLGTAAQRRRGPRARRDCAGAPPLMCESLVGPT